jgi:glycosyltransferase involved in cell wall biosynthesis
LIVIDNGSNDQTGEVLECFAQRLPLLSLSEPRPGKNGALNHGLESARGELLVFTDDDIIPDRDWLTELHSASQRWPQDDIFGGCVTPLFPPGAPDWLTAADFVYASRGFVRFHPRDDEGPIPWGPFGPNMAIRSRLMQTTRYDESIGPRGHDYPMGSESELLRRLKRRGHRAIYTPAARVQHVIEPHQLTMKWLLRRAYRFGRGQARLKPDLDSVRLLGAPRWMWRKLAGAWLNYVCRLLASPPTRFEAGHTYYEWIGQIREHQILAAESRKCRASPASVPAWDA